MRLQQLSFYLLTGYLVISSALILPRQPKQVPKSPEESETNSGNQVTTDRMVEYGVDALLLAGVGGLAFLIRKNLYPLPPLDALLIDILKKSVKKSDFGEKSCALDKRKAFMAKFEYDPGLSRDQDLKLAIKWLSECLGEPVPYLAAGVEQEAEALIQQEEARRAKAETPNAGQGDIVVDPEDNKPQHDQFDVGSATADLGLGGMLTWGASQMVGHAREMLPSLAQR